MPKVPCIPEPHTLNITRDLDGVAAVLVIWAMDIQENFSIRRIILNILASGWGLTGLTEVVINLSTKKLLSFYDLEWNVSIDKDLLTLFSTVFELHPPTSVTAQTYIIDAKYF